MTTILNAMLAAAAEQPSMLPTILMFVALGAVMYFFMIRPQQKKQKEINNFRNCSDHRRSSWHHQNHGRHHCDAPRGYWRRPPF